VFFIRGRETCLPVSLSALRWMPPEVLGGGEQGHLSADVWAFGTVLWEVGSGWAAQLQEEELPGSFPLPTQLGMSATAHPHC
jgi:serine/threonine protein kinase